MKRIILGIDVSKETLDIAILIAGKQVDSSQIGNSPKAFSAWLKQFVKQYPSGLEDLMVCMENTGVYCYPVMKVCQQQGIFLWVEDAGRIKAFHSLSRGKNDSLDALRIATYAYLKQSEAKRWEAPREIILKLKSMLQLRKRLLDTKQRLSVPVKEEQHMQIKGDHHAHVLPILKSINKELKLLEKTIRELIKSDEGLQTQYDLATSVKGIGFVVGLHIIVLTNEFKNISDPRKMACHCGLAPFPYQSGKSIKGRTKVSHRAHKPIKALLNMAARSSVACEGELRAYYERKVAEGKNKMSVLNAIRNKLVHRVFACVRDNRKYEDFYTPNVV